MLPTRGRARYWVPLLVLVVGLLLTLGVWQRSRAQHERSVEDYFEFRSREAMLRIEDRLHYYQQSLLATRGLFGASESVRRAEFARFVASLDLAGRYPGLQGIGFALLVPAAGRARHVAQVRGEGFPDYRMRPEGNREEYTSIVFLEPFRDRNLRAFGYDMYSEPVRHEAMRRARDTGRIGVSGKVMLIQEDSTDTQAGFLVYVPVYRNGQPASTLDQRRQNLAGWVYAPFRMNDLMRGVLGESGTDVDIEIYDGAEASPPTLMWDRATTHGEVTRQFLRSSQSLSFGDRSWTVVIRALPGLLARHGGEQSAIIIVLGSVASLLLGLLTFSVMGQLEKVRQLNVTLEHRVEERTRSLRESEEKFRTVADYTYDWELWEDARGAVVYCSPSCERVTGYSADAFRFDPGLLERLIHPEDLPRWKAHKASEPVEPRRQWASSPPVEELAFRVIRTDGTVHWIGHVCYAIEDAEGRPLGRRVSNRDITRRKQDEAQLLLLAHDLEQVNQEMEDTLYAASHDLRSPLLNVRGFAGNLEGTCARVRARLHAGDVPESVRGDLEPMLAEEIPASLHFIQSGGQKLDSLIDGLLEVSRARRLQLHVEVVDMVRMMDEVRGAMAFQLQEAGATLEIGELPPCRADARALNRVFSNFIDNALKYRHPDRAPRIRVSGQVRGGKCVYAVEDNGLGIDPRHHARIWKLFHRLDPDGPIQGEGLGLTLAQRILTRLRGRAWVDSNPGTGSGCCFHVELPASARAA
jgi:PAS domain S-box-containing protein